MRISFIPAGSRNLASSRIRVYALVAPLARLGIGVEVGRVADADAVVVQKRLDHGILASVRLAKAAGKLIVYDCDDLGAVLEDWAPRPLREEMISLADVVTTNSEGFREALREEHRAGTVEILPDTIDYGLVSPIEELAPETGRLRVLWFGNCCNFSMIRPYLASSASVADLELVVCTHLCERTADAQEAWPAIHFVDWSLKGFPALLRSCHLSLLTHQGGAADRAKSNNRMIASICWGVPALVSRTPEYERTARLAGVVEAIFDGPDELASLVERHRPAAVRRRYLARAQRVLWQRHAPDAVARRLLEIVSSHHGEVA
jgi:hypothetical protein